MKEKICCFAGHRNDWHCLGIEEKLLKTIEDLILKGYSVFYDGGYGAFDIKCANIVLELRDKYPHIKLFRILTYYHHNKEKYELPYCYNGSIFPDIEEIYPKQKISKRNEWIVDNSDILVCHIEFNFKSGAYNMVKYAKKKNKTIIYV